MESETTTVFPQDTWLCSRSSLSPYVDFIRELASFNPVLLQKIQFIVAAKIDIMEDGKRLEAVERYCRDEGLTLLKISSVSGAGIPELVYTVDGELRRLANQADPVKVM